MNIDTLQKLDKLQLEIVSRVHEEMSASVDNWQKYDVMICHQKDESVQHWLRLPAKSLEFHHVESRRRVIATRYAGELIWLFDALGEIHPEEIERYSWHDFYGLLADTANQYIEERKTGVTASRLLEVVLDKVRQIYR